MHGEEEVRRKEQERKGTEDTVEVTGIEKGGKDKEI